MADWPTPDISLLSNPQECRKISVPGDLWYLVQGALEELARVDNWEEFGTATIQEMAQFFRDVNDDFSESRCGMNWVSGSGHVLFSETFLAVDGYQIVINRASLPAQFQDATSLICEFQIQTFDSSGRLLEVSQADGSAPQRFRVMVANFRHYFTVQTPIENGVRFTVNETAGNSVYWRCNIVGWS